MLGPNIYGGSDSWNRFISATGAMYVNGQSTTNISSGSNTGYHGLNFAASRSNSIYADNGKVYPLSLALNFIIKT